jgi:hypothetical protein
MVSLVEGSMTKPSALSQSFIEIDETKSYTAPRKVTEEGKRDTSTTAPPHRNAREPKSASRQQKN